MVEVIEFTRKKRYARGAPNPPNGTCFMPKTILVVDDDPHVREVVTFALEKAGMKTVSAQDGAEALRMVGTDAPSLIVLDVNMPEMDGLEVCKQVRKSSQIPILFLSSRDDEIDRIIGLEIGGDDYVTKPFSPRELVARVNVILKRMSPQISVDQDNPAQLSFGSVTLDAEQYRIAFAGKSILLTSTEFAMLQGLLRHPGKVFDRDRLMDIAYDDNIHVSDRTIDSHIRNIRQKFQAAGCASIIETVHGVGYKLGLCL